MPIIKISIDSVDVLILQWRVKLYSIFNGVARECVHTALISSSVIRELLAKLLREVRACNGREVTTTASSFMSQQIVPCSISRKE